MEGVNDTCTDLIKFIKDLKKDKKWANFGN
jgi:hypothetical protein